MQDAMRAYLELALGLTEGSRKRAQQVVRDVLGKGEAKASQVQSMATELMETSRANRETLARLVRFEVERALGAVGLATAEEVAELTARVQDLERRSRNDADLTGAAVPGRGGDATGQPSQAGAKKSTTKKATAKKAAAKSTGKKSASAKKTTAKKTTTKKAVKTASPAERPGGAGAAGGSSA